MSRSSIPGDLRPIGQSVEIWAHVLAVCLRLPADRLGTPTETTIEHAGAVVWLQAGMGAAQLRGEVAIVACRGRGVGRAVVEGLAAAGAAVSVAARTGDEIDLGAEAISAAGGRPIALQTVVTDKNSVDTLVKEVRRRLGPPTLLVNNVASGRVIGWKAGSFTCSTTSMTCSSALRRLWTATCTYCLVKG